MNDNIIGVKYDLTADITGMLDDIESCVWLIGNMLMEPRHKNWLQREARVKRASATTSITGAALDEQSKTNAMRAYDFADYISGQQDICIDELVIRNIHREMMQGVADGLAPGVYRKGEHKLINYMPPSARGVGTLMRLFSAWLNSDDDIHPVIQAGLAHVHLFAIHPFNDGNGRTARTLSTLMLGRAGYGFRKLLGLENALLRTRTSYFEVLDLTLGKKYSASYDATLWLEYFVDTLLGQSQMLLDDLMDWHRMREDYRIKYGARGLQPRQADGLAYAHKLGRMSRPVYIEVTGASTVTASRDLAKLLALGLLRAEGSTKSRVYYPVWDGQRG